MTASAAERAQLLWVAGRYPHWNERNFDTLLETMRVIPDTRTTLEHALRLAREVGPQDTVHALDLVGSVAATAPVRPTAASTTWSRHA